VLIFDAGPVGADCLPAHAHCDLLNFEMSPAGARLFVDSGTFDYEESPMRAYCRSTAAHNVLQIDGVEQCDVWSRFRMGYRGRPSPPEHGATDGFHWCWATHNAYRRIGVPTVGRWLACRTGGPWFCLDWCCGEGQHTLDHRLHLHPDAKVEVLDGATARINHVSGTYYLSYCRSGTLHLQRGWHCPRFGVRFESQVLVRTVTEIVPAAVGCVLSRDQLVEPPQVGLDERGRPTFVWSDSTDHLQWSPSGR